MKRTHRELLLNLIIYCDKSDCDIVSINFNEGTYKNRHEAVVKYKNGVIEELYNYTGLGGEWKLSMMIDKGTVYIPSNITPNDNISGSKRLVDKIRREDNE